MRSHGHNSSETQTRTTVIVARHHVYEQLSEEDELPLIGTLKGRIIE